MNSLIIAPVVFVFCFGAALAGMALRVRLPEGHVDSDSREVMKLVMGLIATMAALVLGLLIASAKNTYDTQATELQQVAVNIVQIDEMLALYGPQTREVRGMLKVAVEGAHDRVWPANNARPDIMLPEGHRATADVFFEKLHELAPATEAQRYALTAALQIGSSLGHTRLLMSEQLDGSVSWLLLAVLVFWVTVLFLGFGLFARLHVTMTVAFIIGALSVSSAIFLILELSRPYEGVMHLSDAPLRNALAVIDR